MTSENKFAYSFTTGIMSTIVSCAGMNIHHSSIKDDLYSTENKYIYGYDKDVVFMFSSAILGLLIMIMVYIGITAYESYQEKKESEEEASFWKIFWNKLFSSDSLLALITFIIAGVALAFLGMILFALIGIAVFLIPLIKGKFNR